MKFFLLIFFLILSFSSCRKSSSLDCDKFRNGVFKYGETCEVDGITYNMKERYPELDVKIERKGHTHIETYQPLDKFSKYLIEWQSSCEYTLTLEKSSMNIYDVGDKITTKILSVSDSSCVYESTSKYGKIKSSIIKLE